MSSKRSFAFVCLWVNIWCFYLNVFSIEQRSFQKRNNDRKYINRHWDQRCIENMTIEQSDLSIGPVFTHAWRMSWLHPNTGHWVVTWQSWEFYAAEECFSQGTANILCRNIQLSSTDSPDSVTSNKIYVRQESCFRKTKVYE